MSSTLHAKAKARKMKGGDFKEWWAYCCMHVCMRSMISSYGKCSIKWTACFVSPHHFQIQRPHYPTSNVRNGGGDAFHQRVAPTLAFFPSILSPTLSKIGWISKKFTLLWLQYRPLNIPHLGNFFHHPVSVCAAQILILIALNMSPLVLLLLLFSSALFSNINDVIASLPSQVQCNSSACIVSSF